MDYECWMRGKHPSVAAGRAQEYVIHYIKLSLKERWLCWMSVDSIMYFIIEFMDDAVMYNFVVMFCLSLPLCVCVKICLVHFPHQQISKS